MEQNVDVAAARGRFPSGLEQPEGSYRFGADALLLADAAASLRVRKGAVFAEIGTGCGAAAFSLLLHDPAASCVGLEIGEELVLAARRNARRLGLQDRFSVVPGDAADRRALAEMRRSPALAAGGAASGFDAVICNPPWRRPECGRVPPSAMRRRALFDEGGAFGVFFSAADALLADRGVLLAVAGAERTADMAAALPARLRLQELEFVFTGRNAAAELVLMKAVKNGGAPLRVLKRVL